MTDKNKPEVIASMSCMINDLDLRGFIIASED